MFWNQIPGEGNDHCESHIRTSATLRSLVSASPASLARLVDAGDPALSMFADSVLVAQRSVASLRMQALFAPAVGQNPNNPVARVAAPQFAELLTPERAGRLWSDDLGLTNARN